MVRPVDTGLADYKDYEYYEDNSDPHFRPGLNKLVTKMRGLSILTDRPDSVAFLIKDLSHYYFIRDTKHPQELWYLIGHLVQQWGSLAGGWDWVAEKDASVVDTATTLWGTGKVEGVGTGGNEDAQLWPQRLGPDDNAAEAYRVAWEAGYKAGRDGEAAVVSALEPFFGLALGEAPAVIRNTPHNTDVNFKDKSLKLGVAGVISLHFVIMDDEVNMVECGCDKRFDSITAWSIHVRKRIWRYILDVYPTLGADDGAS